MNTFTFKDAVISYLIERTEEKLLANNNKPQDADFQSEGDYHQNMAYKHLVTHTIKDALMNGFDSDDERKEGWLLLLGLPYLSEGPTQNNLLKSIEVAIEIYGSCPEIQDEEMSKSSNHSTCDHHSMKSKIISFQWFQNQMEICRSRLDNEELLQIDRDVERSGLLIPTLIIEPNKDTEYHQQTTTTNECWGRESTIINSKKNNIMTHDDDFSSFFPDIEIIKSFSINSGNDQALEMLHHPILTYSYLTKNLLRLVLVVITGRHSRSRGLHYTQGLHEIASYVMKVCGVFQIFISKMKNCKHLLYFRLLKSILLFERICLLHIVDYLSSPLELSLSNNLRIIGFMIWKFDPPIFSLLTLMSQIESIQTGRCAFIKKNQQKNNNNQSEDEIVAPSFLHQVSSGHEFQFCLSWILTLFTHELLPYSMKENVLGRIWDAILAGPPQFPLFLCVAISKHFNVRQEIVKLALSHGVVVIENKKKNNSDSQSGISYNTVFDNEHIVIEGLRFNEKFNLDEIDILQVELFQLFQDLFRKGDVINLLLLIKESIADAIDMATTQDDSIMEKAVVASTVDNQNVTPSRSSYTMDDSVSQNSLWFSVMSTLKKDEFFHLQPTSYLSMRDWPWRDFVLPFKLIWDERRHDDIKVDNWDHYTPLLYRCQKKDFTSLLAERKAALAKKHKKEREEIAIFRKGFYRQQQQHVPKSYMMGLWSIQEHLFINLLRSRLVGRILLEWISISKKVALAMKFDQHQQTTKQLTFLVGIKELSKKLLQLPSLCILFLKKIILIYFNKSAGIVRENIPNFGSTEEQKKDKNYTSEKCEIALHKDVISKPLHAQHEPDIKKDREKDLHRKNSLLSNCNSLSSHITVASCGVVVSFAAWWFFKNM